MKAQDLLALVRESSKGTKTVDGEVKKPTYDNLNTPDNHVSGKGTKEVKNAKKDFGKKRDKKNPANPGTPRKSEKGREMGGPPKTYKRMAEQDERTAQVLARAKQGVMKSIQKLDVKNGLMIVTDREGRPQKVQMDPAQFGPALKQTLTAIKRSQQPKEVMDLWGNFVKSAMDQGSKTMQGRPSSGHSVGKPLSAKQWMGGNWSLADSEGDDDELEPGDPDENWWPGDEPTEEPMEAEGGYPEGRWIYQKAGSDTEHWAYVVGPNKAIVVPVYDGRTIGNAATKSTKNWHPEPRMVRGDKIPPRVKAKIMKKMQKMGHGTPMGESYSDADSMSWDQPVKKGGPVSKTGKVRGNVDDEPTNKADPGKPKDDGKSVQGDGANLGKIMNPKQVAKVQEGIKGLEKLLGRKLGIKRSFNQGSKSKVQEGMDPVLYQYLRTALWSSTDMNTEENLDKDYDVDDFGQEAMQRARGDLIKFQNAAGEALDGLDMTKVAHDLWLTRNGHGAGFWDGDYSDNIGKILTKLAQQMGEVHPIVGEDNKIYFY